MVFYLLAALLLALLAGALTFTYLEQLRAQAVPTAMVAVAQVDVAPGTILSAEMVAQEAVPEGLIPEGALRDPAEVIGHVALQPVVAHQIFLKAMLSGYREGALSARLPDGRWAMVLPSSWLISPVPSLEDGDRIDLVAYFKGDPQRDAGVIVTAVKILAVAREQDVVEHLTLAVDLDEAIKILYARVNGFAILPLLRPQGAGP
jgi:Flp pilus assembly protein CpaB